MVSDCKKEEERGGFGRASPADTARHEVSPTSPVG